MSMLGSIYRAIRSMLFDEVCMSCGCSIDESSRGLCMQCRYDMPTTDSCKEEDNLVYDRLSSFVPIHRASALYFYSSSSPWRDLIHRFKYGGRWYVARNMGRIYGAELKSSGLYDDIDVVVPIPLHPLKRLHRGYNQAEYLAEGIAQELGVKVERRALCRRRNNPSQARRRFVERWENLESLFGVRYAEALRGRHVLLVDDVLTTGATLCSCIETIISEVPDCRISVAVLAVTSKIDGKR